MARDAAAEQPDWSRLSVCIPAYNEADGIAQTLRALREAVPTAELLVVDDGSTDATAAEAEGVAGVTVLRHPRNMGYGQALKTAMRAATRPCLAWYDADGQHRPEDLLRVAAPVLASEKDVAIGARQRGSDRVRRRMPGKWIIGFAARFVARQRIPDLNSGLRCFRREVILRYLELLPAGFSASSTSTLVMVRRGYRLAFVPITTRKRVGVSTVKIFRDGFRTLHLIMHILILFDAFRVFSGLALGVAGAGIVYGLYDLVRHGLGLSVLAAMLVLVGVLIFFFGVLCDQITALRFNLLERFAHRDAPER